MDKSKEIINLISKERKRQGVSITELCRLIGCSRESYYCWERGDKSIKLDTADKALKVLGTSYILGGEVCNDDLRQYKGIMQS